MTDAVKIAVAGPGLIGRKHVQLIHENPNCCLSAIIAPNTPDNEEFCATNNVTLYADFDSAFASEKIDAAIISSPNEFHYEQVLACIARGIPTLVEKPLTSSVSEADRLVEKIDKTKTPVLVGHHRTYSTLIDPALDFLRSSSFGDLVALQGSALFRKPESYFLDGPWRKEIGGGPILINLIHEIGLMRLFAGEIVAVQALASHDIRQFSVEDTVSIALKFAGGALGSFILSDTAASSKSWEMTSGENPSYPHYSDENCYHFTGTNGSLDFPSMRAKSYRSDVTPSWWNSFDEHSIQFERKDPLMLQLEHFLDVVRHDVEPRVSARDGYMNMLVVEAIQRSIQTGSAVRLENIVSEISDGVSN